MKKCFFAETTTNISRGGRHISMVEQKESMNPVMTGHPDEKDNICG
jgi:hypothetical protein